MAYTLKTTGIATKAVAVVALDEDGTLKEFVTGKTPSTGLDVHANVTTNGTAAFRSAGTRGYFETFDATRTPEAIAFTANIDFDADRTANIGLACVVVMAGSSFFNNTSNIVHMHRSADTTAATSETLSIQISSSPIVGNRKSNTS